MKKRTRGYWLFGAAGVALLSILLIVSLACAGEATPTPAPRATPAPAAAPTVAPAPTAAPAPVATPTPVVASKIQYGGTLRFITRPISQIGTLDPAYSTIFTEYFVMFSVYDNLVELGPKAEILPQLATSWDISADSKTVTFKLLKGAKFQDGTDFNAEAVKWNIQRMLDSQVTSPNRAQILAVDRAEVVDNETVALRLKNPFRPLMAALADRPGMMASPTAVEKYKSYSERLGEYARRPIGTGPFRLLEWRPGERVVVEKNLSYWDKGKPYLDQILYTSAAEEVRVAMVRTGEADLLEIDPWAMRELRKVEGNPNIRIVGGPSGRHTKLQFDARWGPFQQKGLRQAIGFAIDRDKVSEVVFGGRARPGYGPLGAGWAAYDTAEFKKIISYDPQKAKAKLAEAGYPNGVTVPFWCRSDAESERIYCEVVQAMLGEVGITVELTMRPYADIVKGRPAGLVKMESTWFTPRGDPHGDMSLNFHSTAAFNYYKFSNSEVDRLITEAATIFDLAKAKELYAQIQRLIVEDATWVFVNHPDAYAVASKKVQNWVWHADLIVRLRNLWLEN